MSQRDHSHSSYYSNASSPQPSPRDHSQDAMSENQRPRDYPSLNTLAAASHSSGYQSRGHVSPRMSSSTPNYEDGLPYISQNSQVSSAYPHSPSGYLKSSSPSATSQSSHYGASHRDKVKSPSAYSTSSDPNAFLPYDQQSSSQSRSKAQYSPISNPPLSPRLSAPKSPVLQGPQWASYECESTSYAMGWSNVPGDAAHRMAIGSFAEDSTNTLRIIKKTSERAYECIAMAETLYPVSKVAWEPWRSRSGQARNSDLLATAGDYLKLWELSSEAEGSKLKNRARLYNTKTDHAAPLTSFDWNETDPSLIVTSSIDTTCTVWNVETQQAKTQLIAHDREVYDVAFASGSVNVFASVGADGSVRMFDLRALEHSTIVYETMPSYSGPAGGSSGAAPASLSANGKSNKAPTPPPALLRISFNKLDSNLLATFSSDSSSVQVLDIRVPGVPIYELRAHSSNINAIMWAPTHRSYFASASDDGQILIWDVQGGRSEKDSKKKNAGTYKALEPIMAYTAESEIQQIAWSQAQPEWIALNLGRTIRMLAFD